MNRHRPTEYDTYPDPIGPLSASAQFLFGAISSFVTGLADVPAEVVVDLVSAGRAIGHPQAHIKPHSKWHRKPHNEDELASDESSTEQAGTETQRAEPGSSHSSNDVLEEESESDEEMVDAQSQPDEIGMFPDTIDRRRSLQLENTQTMGDEIIPSHTHNFFVEAASHGRRMSMKFINLVIWLPTDLSLSLAKGFHNAPKLYHDPMVKSTPKVKSVRSGFRAAGKVSAFNCSLKNSIYSHDQELCDGFYYGVTGLVTQPRYGYKNKGTKGMLKGMGKGVGGVFLKPPAGMRIFLLILYWPRKLFLTCL